MRCPGKKTAFPAARTARNVHLGTDLGGWVLPETVVAELDVKVDVLDLGSRSANVLKGLRIRSIRQLLSEPKTRLLRSPRFGAQSMAEVERKVSQYLAGKWPPRVDYQYGKKNALGVSNPGTKVLVDHMLSILPERERSILAARFGLWDDKAQTLASIGSRLGLSRERVRQIEARGLRRLGRVFGSSRVKDLFGRKFAAFMRKDGLTETMADDCTPQEVALAVQFLQHVWCDGKQH